MSWHHGRIVAFDVETTGVDVHSDRIVTAAVVSVGGGAAADVRTWLADPGIEIAEGATKVHGISTEKARAEGQEAAAVVAQVIALLRSFPPEVPLAIMNARFDMSMLWAEASRYSILPLEPRFIVDPFVMDKHLDRFRRGSRKLDAICAARGVRLENAHDAHADALAAARAAWVLAEKGRVVRNCRNDRDAAELVLLEEEWERVRHDLPALHAAQVVWAREQADSLRDYFTKAGKLKEAGTVRSEWPVVLP